MHRENTALSKNAIEIMEYINEKYPAINKGIRNKYRQLKDIFPLKEITGVRFRLSDDINEKIIERAKPDILWLKNNFGIDYTANTWEAEDLKPVYDEVYYNDCTRAYDKLNDFLKGVFHEFILEKIQNTTNGDELEIFHRISNYFLGLDNNQPNDSLERIKSKKKTWILNFMKHYSNSGIKKVVVQMGMDKTASTSIQVFLSRNREWLNKNSHEYRTNWGSDNHSVPLKSLVHKKPDKIYWHVVSGHDKDEVARYNMRNLSALCKGVKECRRETYIFYGEGICGFHFNELKVFKKLIKTLMPDAKIDILYCVRSIPGYASSGYQQAVRMGDSFSKKRLLMVYSNIYFRRLIRAIMIFGKKCISVYKFEETLTHEFGPVGYFIMKLGIPTGELCELEIPRINKSVSSQAIEIIEFINKEQPLIFGGKLNDRRYNGDIDAITQIPGNKYSMSGKRMRMVVKLSLFDLLWLGLTFGIKYPLNYKDDENPMIKYDEEYSKMFIEAFNKSNDSIKSCMHDFVKKKMNDLEESDGLQILVKLENYINEALKIR